MRKASVGEAQHNLSRVLEYVAGGEEVLITRRNKVVARIVPPDAGQPADYPQFAERARRIFADARGKDVSRIIVEDREERF